MNYFTFTFEYWTRPWFRKGRLKVEEHAFAAPDLLTAMKVASEWGKQAFPRRKMQITAWRASGGASRGQDQLGSGTHEERQG